MPDRTSHGKNSPGAAVGAFKRAAASTQPFGVGLTLATASSVARQRPN